MKFMRQLAVSLSLLALPSAALAQDLDTIVNRDKVLLQKLFDEVNGAVEKSRGVEKNEPAKARFILEEALTKIQNSTVCPEEQRAALRRRVNTRLAEVNSRLRELQAAAEETARREMEKSRRENPGADKTPSDIAKQRIISVKDQILAAERIREKAARGTGGVLESLVAAATPIEGNVEFPKYWDKLSERRKQTMGTKLTDKEVALLRALNSTLSVNFDNTRFRDVLEYLSERTGQAIFADDSSLKDANVEYDDPVTFKGKKLTLRTILRKILADKGLTYVLKEGTIQVVSHEKARQELIVRAYPIDDLVGSGSPQLYGPFIAYNIRMQNVQTLINNIQTAIEPAFWEPQGGPGRITYNEATNALLIRAPAELHYMLGGGSLMSR